MLPEQLPDLRDAPDELLLTRPKMAVVNAPGAASGEVARLRDRRFRRVRKYSRRNRPLAKPQGARSLLGRRVGRGQRLAPTFWSASVIGSDSLHWQGDRLLGRGRLLAWLQPEPAHPGQWFTRLPDGQRSADFHNRARAKEHAQTFTALNKRAA